MKNFLAFIIGGLLVLAPVCAVFVGMYIGDVHADRKKHVVVSGPVPVFSAEGEPGRALCFSTDPHKIKIATISPGDELAVRRVRYEKDCMTVRVRLKTGQEGFVVSGEGQWDLK